MTLGVSSDARVAAEYHHATGGNPFLLSALLSDIDRRHPPGVDELLARLDGDALPEVVRALAHGLEPLSPAARHALEAAVVLGNAATVDNIAELIDATPSTVEEAADAMLELGLVKPGWPLRLEHPLVASTVHRMIPADRRQQAHERAATLLAEAGAPLRRRGSPPRPDRPLGRRRTGVVARRRGAAGRGRGRRQRGPRALQPGPRRATRERPSRRHAARDGPRRGAPAPSVGGRPARRGAADRGRPRLGGPRHARRPVAHRRHPLCHRGARRHGRGAQPARTTTTTSCPCTSPWRPTCSTRTSTRVSCPSTRPTSTPRGPRAGCGACAGPAPRPTRWPRVSTPPPPSTSSSRRGAAPSSPTATWSTSSSWPTAGSRCCRAGADDEGLALLEGLRDATVAAGDPQAHRVALVAPAARPRAAQRPHLGALGRRRGHRDRGHAATARSTPPPSPGATSWRSSPTAPTTTWSSSAPSSPRWSNGPTTSGRSSPSPPPSSSAGPGSAGASVGEALEAFRRAQRSAERALVRSPAVTEWRAGQALAAAALGDRVTARRLGRPAARAGPASTARPVPSPARCGWWPASAPTARGRAAHRSGRPPRRHRPRHRACHHLARPRRSPAGRRRPGRRPTAAPHRRRPGGPRRVPRRSSSGRAPSCGPRAPGPAAWPSPGSSHSRPPSAAWSTWPRGTSNADIAGQLFISVKTVESHLAHAYRKLGISSLGGAARPDRRGVVGR